MWKDYFPQFFGVLFDGKPLHDKHHVIMAQQVERIFIGDIIDVKDNCTNPNRFEERIRKNSFLAVKGNKIVGIDSIEKLAHFKKVNNFNNAIECRLSKNEILVPGLIDTHIHAPQYPNAGLGYDKPLLDWLQKYTYPLETKYKDLQFSQNVYDKVVLKTLSHGTTTACYFATMFVSSSKVLVDSLVNHGQRGFVGKINMQRNAPEDYLETPEDSIRDTLDFIEYVAQKDCDLVQPIITPRFAPSCEAALLKELGNIAAKYDLHIQSHISENQDEVVWVRDLFNESYGNVYEQAGLLTRKTVMAHGVFLTDDEVKLLANKHTAIAHCPLSNTDLRSGLCDVKRLIQGGVTVGLGTDVSGGESPSIVAVMRGALQTSIHISFGKNGYAPFDYWTAFYLATLGGAQALSLEEKIGNFEVGKDFDALVVNLKENDGMVDLIDYKEYDPSELLQKFIYVGDDRNVKEVYVAGNKVKSAQ